MWTFKKAFDRLTEAYIKDQVNPFDQCACFVGNLLNGKDWTNINLLNSTREYENFYGFCIPIGFRTLDHIKRVLERECDSFYTPDNVDVLEKLFLKVYHQHGGRRHQDIDEDALFKAFEVTLDLLKKIHESHGEVVDQYEFKQRQLI